MARTLTDKLRTLIERAMRYQLARPGTRGERAKAKMLMLAIKSISPESVEALAAHFFYEDQLPKGPDDSAEKRE